MQPAFDLFSDIFAYRDNVLTRLDPRVKLVVAGIAILTIIVSSHVFLPLTVFAVSLTTVLALRLPLRLVMMRLAAPMGIVCVLVILQSLLIGSTPIFSFSVMGWSINFMREGAWRGILMGSRVLGAVSVVLLLSSVTQAHQIFQALRWLGVPKGWVEVAMLMYRYIFALLDQACDVMAAQRLRLGYAGLRRSVTSLGNLAGAVLVQSMDQATRTYDAMKLRGYKGYMPFGPLRSLSTREIWIMGILTGIMLCTYLLIEWAPL
jgi:cobalt/nickel transport system permease protein